ncbi:hypothetical protein NX059_006004 [Plenodomus lindquistii]|nr:hypothetical protein NX059_006004 [Plenodomus lindquistii]
MAQQIMSLREEDEDWRKLTDANERRRAQNRIAQRNYRRNIKRRLQQLETFTRSGGSPVTSPTSKPQQPCHTPTRLTPQFGKTILSPITPATSDVLLPELENNGIDAGASDTSSSQTVLYGHTEITKTLPPKNDQKEAIPVAHQAMDNGTGFDCITPLEELENDLLLFVSPLCILWS